MKALRPITEAEVLRHWKTVEGHAHDNFRPTLRRDLPKDLRWQVCTLEAQDIARMYVVSSIEWVQITGNSQRLTEVPRWIYLPSPDPHVREKSANILAKIDHLRSGKTLDTHLILVTDSEALEGPFIILEGNRRAVAFLTLGTLAGCEVYVGCSPGIRTYQFAFRAYPTGK